MSESSVIQISDFDEHFKSVPPLQAMNFDLGAGRSLSVDCLRLDKVHPFISGNKWYKLKYHIQAASLAGKSRLLSFGGAHSNHLHALAFAGKKLQFQTVGVVRGEAPEVLTPTLQDCVDWGMSLQWLSRRDYRNIAPLECINDYSKKYPDTWIIPEGGASDQGALGIQELFNDLSDAGDVNHDLIACPVGSGATLAGIVNAKLKSAAGARVHCIGFSALRGAYDLESRVANHLVKRNFNSAQGAANSWQISHDYHFGGFAKINTRLTDFISNVYQKQGVLLDPIYTGKMLYGLLEWAHQGRIKPNARILVVHTGGLQGWRGFGDKVPK